MCQTLMTCAGGAHTDSDTEGRVTQGSGIEGGLEEGSRKQGVWRRWCRSQICKIQQELGRETRRKKDVPSGRNNRDKGKSVQGTVNHTWFGWLDSETGSSGAMGGPGLLTTIYPILLPSLLCTSESSHASQELTPALPQWDPRQRPSFVCASGLICDLGIRVLSTPRGWFQGLETIHSFV